jgi:hypothetical protein
MKVVFEVEGNQAIREPPGISPPMSKADPAAWEQIKDLFNCLELF